MDFDDHITAKERMEQFNLKRAFKDKEAGFYIGMSESWLRHSRIEGARFGCIPGPRFIKIGRSVRYLIEDLDNWLEKFQKLNHLAQQCLGDQNKEGTFLSNGKG